MAHHSVTLQGKEVKLSGVLPEVGQKAPAFRAVAQDLTTVEFPGKFSGKVVVLASVPSLDTPVCDIEGKRFNEESTKLSSDVEIVIVSMDLPFAQKRWCGASGVERLTTLSDHRWASFGNAYGVLMEDLRLLARAVFVVDASGVIRHVQLVPEVTHEPDYDSVLKAVKECIG
ncbi:thiol peroxidase [Thermodesulforhabdus norvegica]|uniref:Thiol peroxidase (Atypical 2-Cys peroxiredoxin) n=1 Tax=Thermodesulforhabdus norvegica TaxID=39841 RepID=A0A1I4VTK1_9BACT|nr:thiol peroxidase [Thermodesulforhabdus norvegica]SFN04502.1 thiol peroxidase (atypical 2-Cys peroxiredoxin) [Thermodesulforhabdus norvegica]